MVNIIEEYKKIIKSMIPSELKRQLESEKGTVVGGLKYTLLGSLPVIVVMLLTTLFNIVLFSSFGQAAAPGYQIAGILTSIAALVLFPIMIIIFQLIINAIMFIFAKLLGGTGTFGNQVYHSGIVSGGLLVVISLTTVIPCVGSLVKIMAAAYSLYLGYHIYKQVHQLSSKRAVILISIPIIITIIIVIVMVIMIAAVLGELVAQLSAAGAYA